MGQFWQTFNTGKVKISSENLFKASANEDQEVKSEAQAANSAVHAASKVPEKGGPRSPVTFVSKAPPENDEL